MPDGSNWLVGFVKLGFMTSSGAVSGGSDSFLGDHLVDIFLCESLLDLVLDGVGQTLLLYVAKEAEAFLGSLLD